MSLNFIKYSNLYFLISSIFIIPSVISLFMFGLKPSIDFTGGSLLEVNISPNENVELSDQKITETLSDTIEVNSVQSTNENYLIRSSSLDPETHQQVLNKLQESLGETQEVRFESVGPTLGAELLKKTLLAVIIAASAILLYVAYQFKELKYGVCAILAMFHDTLIVTGIFSILGHFYGVQVDTLFVTALLTILSFSVHDTIVVYDRIRETLRRHSKARYESIVNKSIAETLARSINNSMTIIFMLTSLYLLGGESVRWFVFALLIGTITGTYSSTFTAVPLLVVWDKIATLKRH